MGNCCKKHVPDVIVGPGGPAGPARPGVMP